METTSPQNYCVLLVEDDAELARFVKEDLLDHGYQVMVAGRVEDALLLLHCETIHAAILDINIGRALVFPVAALLEKQGISYFFASSGASAGIPAEYAARPVLEKPYLMSHLFDRLSQVLSHRSRQGA